MRHFSWKKRPVHRQSSLLIFFICFSILQAACSQLRDNDSDSENTDSSSDIIGLWQGVQKVKTKDLDDELVRDVRLSFGSSGRFRLVLLDSGEEGEGRFSHFESLQAVTLKYDLGSSEKIMLTGSMNDFEYEVFDSELLLKSLRQEFKLKRSENEDALNLDGIWQCQSTNNRFKWLLNFDGQTFYMQRTADTSNEIFMVGEFSLNEPVSGILNDEISLVFRVNKGLPDRLFEQLSGVLIIKSGEINQLTLTPVSADGAEQKTAEGNQDVLTCTMK